MAGTVRHTKLESHTARARLKPGRQPYWQALVAGRVHLGWQRWKGDPAGRWLLRRYVGDRTYRVTAIGLADDNASADGERVLSFNQAVAAARAMVETPQGTVHRLTVRQAMVRYVEYKRNQGQSVADVTSRGTVHILPTLGDLVVSELTAERLRRWLFDLAAGPAQKRPKDGKVQFRAEPKTEDDVRRRRATANRVLTMLKAILNHAYDDGVY